MPIAIGRQPTDDRAMAQPPATKLSQMPIDSDQEAASTHGAMRDEESLVVLARRLAEVAHAFRQAAANPSEVDDIESVAATVTSALGDLAVGAELTANAVMDAERVRRLSRTGVTPSPRARAVSWRLHALGSALRAARDACAAISPADGQSRGRVGFGRVRRT
jgi:hypothetical protein